MLKKMLAFLLAAVVLASAMPATVRADENSGTDTVTDYVLVVDTSGSTSYTDEQKLCEEAVRMFVNMIPLDKARITVIAFGNEDRKSMYVFSGAYSGKVDYAERDRKLIHLLVESQMTPDGAAKERIKDTVDIIGDLAADAEKNRDRSKTPLGLAVMAALDLLQKNNATDGNACIVLMTDGRITSHDHYIKDGNLLYNLKSGEAGEAVRIASSHSWPIYSIELNDDGENTDSSDARVRLEAVAQKTGATYDSDGDGNISREEKGTRVVDDMEDVLHILMSIVARFSDGTMTYIDPDENGIATHDFEIEDMTSEKTIIVQSGVLNKVELLDRNGELIETFDQSVDLDDLVVIRDLNHLCAKLICPEPGEYTLRIHGDAFAGVYILEDSTFGMTLELHAKMNEGILKKDTEIPFEAYFTYKDIPFRSNPFYTTSAPAVLEVVNNVTGEVVETKQMEAGYDGYFYRFPLADLEDGGFTARVTLVDELFQGVPQVSNGITFSTKEQDTLIKENIDKVPEQEIRVGDTIWIRMSDYFLNPDGTAVEYALRGKGAEQFIVQMDGDVMSITAPMIENSYQIELVAQDKNMANYPALPWKITVNDQKIVSEERVSLITDAPQWVIDLAQIDHTSEIQVEHLCFDPDGFPVEFHECTIEDENIVSIIGGEGSWTIRSGNYGTTNMEVVVSDGVVDEFGQLVTTTVEIKVEVLQPWMLLLRKFALAIGALVMAIAALVIWLIIRRTKTSFKDRWDVYVRIQNSAKYKTTYPVDLSAYSKKKIGLKTLLEEDIAPFLPSAAGQEVMNVIDIWMDTDVYNSIEFRAVPKDCGFCVTKRAGQSICTVTNCDIEVKKSAYISSGPLTIVFQQNENMLEIVMEACKDND